MGRVADHGRALTAALLLTLVAGSAAADHAGVPDPFPALPLVAAIVNADRERAHELDAPVPVEDARVLILAGIAALAEAPDCEPWRSLSRAYWELTAEAFSPLVFGTSASPAWAWAAAGARILAARHAVECPP